MGYDIDALLENIITLRDERDDLQERFDKLEKEYKDLKTDTRYVIENAPGSKWWPEKIIKAAHRIFEATK